MASRAKQRRVDATEDDFSKCSMTLIKRLLKVLEYLSGVGDTVDLIPLKLTNCNAAVPGGRPFPKADCSTEESKKNFMLADIFQRGLKILFDFTDQKKVPETCSNQEKYILRKLLRYIEKDGNFPTEDLENKSETQLMTFLANHLFGQLATSPLYIMDKNCSGKGKEDQCLCGRPGCKLTGSYGDTSIGNAEVWHGDLDIIINDEVAVETVDDTPDSPGKKSPIEVKLKSAELSRHTPQIIAEAVVFSFLQKRRHPERDHFLLPCIGVGSTEMLLMFFDSEHDILLESSRIPLLDDKTGEISLIVVVVSWLVVNHRYLCSGLTEEMKEYKADFFSLAKAQIEVYKENLQIGNVISGSFKLMKKSSPKNKRRSVFLKEVHKKIVEAMDAISEKEATDDQKPSTSEA